MKPKRDPVESTNLPEDLPCISLIIPFDAKLNKRDTFTNVLNTIANREIERVFTIYPHEQALPVISKLRKVVGHIDYLNRRNKSLAIVVSPLVEKVYYFNYTNADDILSNSKLKIENYRSPIS